MARARAGKGQGGRIRIQAETFDVRKDEDEPQLVAYLFGQSGTLLARTELKRGEAELATPTEKEPAAVRVVVGPPVEGDDQEVLSTLMRLDAVERLVRPDQVGEILRLPIDRALWVCWLRFCLIRGVLLKRTASGGLTVDLPVCGAEVEIYEVDPVAVIVPKIPDYVLERVRDLVLKEPWPPPPWERLPGGLPFPPQPPGPEPDPGPFHGPYAPRPAEVARAPDELLLALTKLRAELEPSSLAGAGEGEEAGEGGEEEVRLFHFTGGEEGEAVPEEAAASVRALREVPEVVTAAGSGLRAFRRELLLRPTLVHPLLCWIWPPGVTTKLIATVKTDDCGRFRALVHVGCSSDEPDLYFRAFRRIGFFRFPIYGPTPVACHTWWNYACGTELTLVTTSPFAHTCPPCQPVIAPGRWVLAMAVGNTSLAAVHGTGPEIPTTPPGLTGANSAWGDGAPFAGTLRLRFEFDHKLRTDLNVRYYRLRWRKMGSGNPWLDLTDPVWRRYAHMVGSTLMLEPYKLGPQSVGETSNLYEIPPALPPTGQWVIADAVVDTTSGVFRSAELAPANGGEGLYEFELTLFDAAGSAVNGSSLGIAYVVPRTVDLTATIETANAASLGLVTPSGRLVFLLHVDNNKCAASIDPPTVGGSAASDECGLLRYSASGAAVTLPYAASHPFGFARHKFDVHRGATHLPAVSTPGWVPVGPAPGSEVVSTTVGDLLGACTIAGFAETLYVAARATNGWSRQSQYDESKVRAFALAPEGV